jgi:chaperonin GroEL (HSP60 family)
VDYSNGNTLQGLKPVEIAAGYELAYEKVVEILPGLVASTFTDLTDVEKVRKVLKASIMSKQYENYELIAELVAKACGRLSVEGLFSNFYSFQFKLFRRMLPPSTSIIFVW